MLTLMILLGDMKKRKSWKRTACLQLTSLPLPERTPGLNHLHSIPVSPAQLAAAFGFRLNLQTVIRESKTGLVDVAVRQLLQHRG